MYHPKDWHEAYAILASGGAVLAGLIIVATAVRADQILSSLHWRLRARNSTLSMITIMIGSNLVLLPQDITLLGVELIVFNLTWACFLPGAVIVNERRFTHTHTLAGRVLLSPCGGGRCQFDCPLGWWPVSAFCRLLGVFALSRYNRICPFNAAS
jgi:hypothetical protein